MIKIHRLLVVDDSEAFRIFVKSQIKDAYKRIRIIEAKNGKEAIEMIRSQRPNMIMLDINLPDINGFEILKVIKKINPDCAIAIASAYTMEQTFIDEALKYGATEFVPKPMNRILLLKCISNILLRIEPPEKLTTA